MSASRFKVNAFVLSPALLCMIRENQFSEKFGNLFFTRVLYIITGN